MTREEKKNLLQAQLELEQLMNVMNAEIHIFKMDGPEPTFKQLLEEIGCIRILVKYQQLDLESTRREREALERALREKDS